MRIEAIAIAIADLDNGDTIGYFVRGHHDWETLRQGVLLLTDDDVDLNEELVEGTLGIDHQHLWWRCIPVASRFCKYVYWPAVPGKRGAFPVTAYYW